jgi:hypothetical protein
MSVFFKHNIIVNSIKKISPKHSRRSFIKDFGKVGRLLEVETLEIPSLIDLKYGRKQKEMNVMSPVTRDEVIEGNRLMQFISSNETECTKYIDMPEDSTPQFL